LADGLFGFVAAPVLAGAALTSAAAPTIDPTNANAKTILASFKTVLPL
jgi:hypothetical protein